MIDNAVSTPGFRINIQMPEAKLLDLNGFQRLSTGRDDRPGSASDVIFAFRLKGRPSSAGKLKLTGPYGFLFDADCLPGLRVENTNFNDNGVFGEVPWMLGYDP